MNTRKKSISMLLKKAQEGLDPDADNDEQSPPPYEQTKGAILRGVCNALNRIKENRLQREALEDEKDDIIIAHKGRGLSLESEERIKKIDEENYNLIQESNRIGISNRETLRLWNLWHKEDQITPQEYRATCD